MAEREIRRAMTGCQKWHGLETCSVDCIDFYCCQLGSDLLNLRPELETYKKKDMKINSNLPRDLNEDMDREIKKCKEEHDFKSCLTECKDFSTCSLISIKYEGKENKLTLRINFNINISTNGSCTLFTDDVNNVMPLFLAITKTFGNPSGIEYSGAFVECLKITGEGMKFWKEKVSDYIFVDPRIGEPFFLIKDSKLVVNIDRGINRSNKLLWSRRD